MLDFISGAVVLALFFGILALAYHAHMSSIYHDIAEQNAQEIADEMFDEACRNAKIRVKQQLVIVDEMGRKA